MKHLRIFIVMLAMSSAYLQAQTNWEPRVHLTGYINAIMEYSDHQETPALGGDNIDKFGVGLSEAGFLASYMPLEKLEFKTTVVYTPWVNSLQEYVVEMYGAYKVSNGLRLAAGKFLTPLSPTNLYFYAPLNPSATLPMLISHHFLFPQSVSGLQVAGEIGKDFKFGYNGTFGNYLAIGHPRGGILGSLGQEEIVPYGGYLQADAEEAAYPPETFLGGTGRIYVDYNGSVRLGLNTFQALKGQFPVLTLDGAIDYLADSHQQTYGVDLNVKLAGVELNAEYWQGKQSPEDKALSDMNYKAYYGQLIYHFDKVQPWVRYEFLQDLAGQFGTAHPLGAFGVGEIISGPLSSYSAGVAIRPIYELLFKLEFKRIMMAGHVDQESPFASVLDKMEDYNYFQAAIVFSF